MSNRLRAFLLALGLLAVLWVANRQQFGADVIQLCQNFESRAELKGVLDVVELASRLSQKLGRPAELIDPERDGATADDVWGPFTVGIVRVENLNNAGRRRLRAVCWLPARREHDLVVVADAAGPLHRLPPASSAVATGSSRGPAGAKPAGLWGLTPARLEAPARRLVLALGLETAWLVSRDVHHEELPPRTAGDPRSSRWMEILLGALLDKRADYVVAEEARLREEALVEQLTRLRVLIRTPSLSPYLLVVTDEVSPELLSALPAALPAGCVATWWPSGIRTEGGTDVNAIVGRLARRTDEPFVSTTQTGR